MVTPSSLGWGCGDSYKPMGKPPGGMGPSHCAGAHASASSSTNG